MMVCIHYTGSPNLSVLLTQLQPQLHSDDDIYIVDSTADRKGVEIAKIYGTTRCYIYVEVGDLSFEDTVKLSHELAVKNNQSAVFLDENYIISNTFIQNLKRAWKFRKKELWKVNKTPYLQIPANFQWHYASLEDEEVILLPYKTAQNTP